MTGRFFERFEEETLFDPDEADSWRKIGSWGEMSCVDWLERHAERRPEQTAVVDDQDSLTWAQLADATDQFAGALVDLGVEQGDRVAYQVSAGIEWFIVRHGITKAGAIATTLIPRFRQQEIEHIVTKTEPSVYIGMATYRDYDHMDVIDELRESVDSLDHVIAIGDKADVPDWAHSFDEVVASEPLSAETAAERRIHPDYPDTLSTTSGTTGLPKIYYLQQNARLRLAHWWESRQCVTEDDEVVVLAPIQQATGEAWAHYTGLISGATIVVTERSDPAELWRLLDRRPTMMVAIPTQMTKLINHESAPEDLSFLRCVPNAGAPLPQETGRRFEERGTVVLNMYGASDGGAPLAVCPVDRPEVRQTTVGKTHPRGEVKIVDGDGEELPRDEVGEVIWRGPDRLFGYFDDRERTEEAYGVGGPNEGWFHSGDAGILDERGNLSIVGRMDDMIIRGGQNVYPAEIEDAILETGLVDEVAVVGMPDPEYGERVCAYVVTDGDLSLDDIVDGLDTQGLAKYKWPERLEQVDELPRSPGGKIKKTELVEDIESKLEVDNPE